MSYTHLSIIERSKLEILHQQGKSTRAIAQELGRHHAPLAGNSAEIQQNTRTARKTLKRAKLCNLWHRTLLCFTFLTIL
ncbi:helix-turn-helix domain-containing protein [Paenibacillus sp. JJ-223]|nr:helix-turn-helix domain-containing protein [Paenibacillus sp. JJ-223]